MFARDRVGEQEAVLHHQADRGAQRVQGQVAHVVPADPDRAAASRRRTGGAAARCVDLPDPDVADDRDRLARPALAATARAAPAATARSRTCTSSSSTSVRAGRQLDRVRLLGEHRPRVDHLEDPDDAGPRLLADRDQAGQRPGPGRPAAPGRRRTRGTCRALIVAVDRQPAAEREHADLAERRDGLQRRVVPAPSA